METIKDLVIEIITIWLTIILWKEREKLLEILNAKLRVIRNVNSIINFCKHHKMNNLIKFLLCILIIILIIFIGFELYKDFLIYDNFKNL